VKQNKKLRSGNLRNHPHSSARKKRNMKIFVHILFLSVLASLLSCGGGGDPVPKPRGYFRIDLPQKKYVLFDSTYPFTFEYPVYAKIIPDVDRNAEPYWMNIEFPKFKGKVHLSYKTINRNLSKYADDAYNLAMKHIPKASNIEDERITFMDHKVYGVIYNIEGEGAASPYQFFVSDSLTHFVRGALYFNVKPNNDSLAPVIEFLKTDIRHLLKTFQWKKV
jgi:gliding motility-associated lipoprotein GldD